MANVLTDLAADIYKSADVVGREITGAVSSVLINGDDSQRVAKGDTVRSHFTQQPSSSQDISESMTIPEGTDQTVNNKTATIDKAKSIQIPWTGEDMRHVDNGSGFETIYGDQVAQAMRTLVNEIETDLCTDIYQNASRAHGTAGTTPFGSNFDEVAEIRQILIDNGCPPDELSLIMNTVAGTNLRNLAQLQKANESASDALLRQGVLLDLQGLGMKESAQIVSHTAGTGASYQVNSSGGLSVGATTIPVDTGTGTILVGDIVKFSGHSDKYVVVEELSGGDFKIGGPGLRQSVADDEALTLESAYAANFALRRTAAELIIRPPAVPQGGDAADDAMTMQDPRTGLTFEIRAYKGYRKSMFEVAAAWGKKTWKPEHVAVLQG